MNKCKYNLSGQLPKVPTRQQKVDILWLTDNSGIIFFCQKLNKSSFRKDITVHLLKFPQSGSQFFQPCHCLLFAVTNVMVMIFFPVITAAVVIAIIKYPPPKSFLK